MRFSHTQLQQRLAGKTVLITRASYGIGECLAELLAEKQAYLLLVARTEAKLIEVKQRVEAKGRRADISLRFEECGRGSNPARQTATTSGGH